MHLSPFVERHYKYRLTYMDTHTHTHKQAQTNHQYNRYYEHTECGEVGCLALSVWLFHPTCSHEITERDSNGF